MRLRQLVFHCIILVLAAFLAARAKQQEPPKESTPAQGRQPKNEAKPEKAPRKRVVQDLSGFELVEPSKLASQAVAVAGTRLLPPTPVALAPRLGKMYGAEPLFAWSYQGTERGFTLIIRDDQYAQVFRAQVNETEFAYPAEGPRFAASKTYSWTVEPTGGEPCDAARFLVVSPGEQSKIDEALAQITTKDVYSSGLARAKIFTDHRLWYDAIGTYTELIARYPKRAELYEQRGVIYDQITATKPLADEDFVRAEELKAASTKLTGS
jgi:hypothetical protein